MRFLTAWAMDEHAAVLAWRYPTMAEDPFPSGAINEALAEVYNHPTESLDHPYLFIVRDAKHRIIGLVVTDPEGVTLDQPDIDALYWSVVGDRPPKPGYAAGNVEGDTYAIPWRFIDRDGPGSVFPVDPINAILAALYNLGERPFIYPVWNRDNDESKLRQIGLIVSPMRDLPGDPSENWRALSDTYRTITSDEDTYPHDVPWGQKEWNLE